MKDTEHKPSRRDFLKKAGYIAPVILTIKAAPALAGTGSNYCERKRTSSFNYFGSYK